MIASLLANCKSHAAFNAVLKQHGVYVVKGMLGIPKVKRLNKTQSSVKFAYRSGESKPFTVLVNTNVLGE